MLGAKLITKQTTGTGTTDKHGCELSLNIVSARSESQSLISINNREKYLHFYFKTFVNGTDGSRYIVTILSNKLTKHVYTDVLYTK